MKMQDEYISGVLYGNEDQKLMLNELPGYENVKTAAFVQGGILYGKRGKPLKGTWGRSRKYPYSGISVYSKDGRKIHKRLDRIIAIAYVPGRTKLRNEVDHINGVHNDDRPENLRWVSHQENMDAKALREYRRKRP